MTDTAAETVARALADGDAIYEPIYTSLPVWVWYVIGVTIGCTLGYLVCDYLNDRKTEILVFPGRKSLGFCTRDPDHDGPCNGIPMPKCNPEKQPDSSEAIAAEQAARTVGSDVSTS